MKDLIFSPSELNRGELPFVAIAGRPNVGKSTLFNRMIGKRKAITDPTPGVTRDPVYDMFEMDGIPVVLADTGGYKGDLEGLDSLVVDKSLEMIQAADLVILVMDVTSVLAEDEELIKKLRPYSKKTILVVNKVDNSSREDDVWNYYSFGYDKVIPVSATHGNNFYELEDECGKMLRALAGPKVKSALKRERTEKDFSDEAAKKADIKISLIGQPNTGKSTLNNLLTGDNTSIVSDIPGTTRDIIEGNFCYKGRNFFVTDTAGIRRKSKVGENVEYYSVNRAISTIDESDIILLMVDSDKGLSDQDKKIANLVVKKGKGLILVMNKWDLLPEVENQENAIKDRIRFLFPVVSFAPIIPLSALTSSGLGRLLNTVVNVFNQLTRRVDTSILNKALNDWLYDYQPPGKGIVRYKVKYVTQTQINPVHFLLFVNRTKGFPADWVQYMKNRLRKDMGFPSVPILLDLKESGGKIENRNNTK